MTRKQLDSFAHRVMLAGVDLSRFTFGARRRMAFGFSQPRSMAGVELSLRNSGHP